MTTGEALKKELGLEKVIFVTIQKVVGLGLPVFVITFDTRHPSVYISYSKILKLKFSVLKQIIASKPKTALSDPAFRSKKLKLTPPQDIETFNRIIPSRSLIFTRDLAGEWYRNTKLYECIGDNITEVK